MGFGVFLTVKASKVAHETRAEFIKIIFFQIVWCLIDRPYLYMEKPHLHK